MRFWRNPFRPFDAVPMRGGSGPRRRRWGWHAALLAVGLPALASQPGCQGRAAVDQHEPDAEPASATGQVVRLSEKAQVNIGLQIEEAASRSVQHSLIATGWLAVVPGRETVIKAPVSGFYVPPSESRIVEIGSLLARGEELGEFRVLLSPQEEAQLVLAKKDAETLLAQSKVTMEVAEAELRRIQNGAAGVVAGTQVRELEETFEKARAAHRGAQQKLPFLPQEPYDGSRSMKSVPVAAPLSGRVVDVRVAPGQFAVQGDSLWTISDWSSLWIKVPVFEGDLPRINQTAAIEVTAPGMDRPITATPAGVPQPTREGRRTVDVLYELDNSTGRLRPGQAVSVSLPTGQSIEKVIVPQTAILWDGMGNAWIYIEVSTGRFHRQRVELGQMIDEDVVVERGLTVGSRIVTVGAESLHGEEFKGQIQMEDDD